MDDLQPGTVHWVLTILGAPRTKKNHMQMATNPKTGRSFPVQNKLLKQWARSAKLQLAAQWGGRAPLGRPVQVNALILRERATGDLLNFLAAVSDALEDAGVLTDDRWVHSLDGSRMDKDANHPRVVVVLSLLGAA